ncbi:EexN family lipoprotein [Pantoea sp. BAV 3049]|uniref:EexN family lipoprotein n=1 Tax=Pantoea sp. BAV 3049 TaxID=2654188 RepID=UPI00131AC37F|nr:EexN family lipoprotein [Pantoea sp. BAV 3049]
MKKMFLCIMLIGLSGCNDKVYDTSYYSSHMDEAKKVSEKCKNGEITDDNCKNANAALYKEKRKQIMSEMFRH